MSIPGSGACQCRQHRIRNAPDLPADDIGRTPLVIETGRVNARQFVQRIRNTWKSKGGAEKGEMEEKRHENTRTATTNPVITSAEYHGFRHKTLCPLCLTAILVRRRFAFPASRSRVLVRFFCRIPENFNSIGLPPNRSMCTAAGRQSAGKGPCQRDRQRPVALTFWCFRSFGGLALRGNASNRSCQASGRSQSAGNVPSALLLRRWQGGHELLPGD
jgi:hypothetical protein